MSFYPETPLLSVAELTAHIKALIESDEVLADVAVRGEISNYKLHTSGHAYFTLKDEHAALSCVMWRLNVAALDFQPEDGMQVIAYGRVGVYERQGRYQLYVEDMKPAGLGELYLAFERLKKKLETEGLFDPARKRPLPRFPRAIGVITSSTGAGLRDILTIISRRFPPAQLYVIPALVQGADAPPSLIAAIKLAEKFAKLDVLIIGRGGGSMEDLWCFNDEQLARTIAACPIPTISAVGHETDFTIADFVADVRAPTPSAAAEMVVPDRAELLQRLRAYGERLATALEGRARQAEAALQGLLARRCLTHPEERLDRELQTLDELCERALRAVLHGNELRARRLASASAQLLALGPQQVLNRGYSIVRRAEDGAIVRSIKDIEPGARADILVSDGELESQITAVKERRR